MTMSKAAGSFLLVYVLAAVVCLGCGKDDTPVLVPTTSEGNLQVRDGEYEEGVNLEVGPVETEETSERSNQSTVGTE